MESSFNNIEVNNNINNIYNLDNLDNNKDDIIFNQDSIFLENNKEKVTFFQTNIRYNKVINDQFKRQRLI